MSLPRSIELLAPARTADIGCEAILHGADAVYIGAPAYGARAAAGNSVEDIARLVSFAHLYNAKVYVTLNTILYDDELPDVKRLVGRLYEAGVDALIVQDMAFLKMDLPPIELHASTQMDITTPERAAFLEKAGLSQLVLARELGLEYANIQAFHWRLSFMVHSASATLGDAMPRRYACCAVPTAANVHNFADLHSTSLMPTERLLKKVSTCSP